MRPILAGTLAFTLAACGGGDDSSDPSAGKLRADTNFDGALTAKDDGAAGPAVFLANLDDDDSDGRRDSEDAAVNGEADLLDLAPVDVVAWKDAPDGTTGRLTVQAPSSAVRVFRKAGSTGPVGPTLSLGTEDLRSGVHLLVEGIAPVGTPETPGWDGTATISLAVKGGPSSRVSLRVAPVLFQYNTAAPSRIFYSGYVPQGFGLPDNEVFGDAIRAALPGGPEVDALRVPGNQDSPWDQWAQDFFDIAHTSRPGPHGVPVDMKIAVRSAQPTRPAGSVVEDLLGPDMGFIEVSSGREPSSDLSWSMNSFGDWDVIPPHTGWPLGRNIWGALPDSPSSRPDDTFADFVRAQRVQGEFNVDTSWLVVGHVDEILSFAEAEGGKFHVFAGSPSLSRSMLLDLQAQGHGNAAVFPGLWEYDFSSGAQISSERSVDEILQNDEVMASSQEAQLHIDDAVALVAAETGIAVKDVVPFPTLFFPLQGRLTAYQPGTVNLLPVGKDLLIPKPFGPQIAGADPFEQDLISRLTPLGYSPKFVDDWFVYHINLGEVHCGTNAVKAIDVRFWEVSP
jgi:protein-arginine deiminase